MKNDKIHIYIFVDERAPGWGTDFLDKARLNTASEEWRVLINGVLSYPGMDLWNDGQVTVVFPWQWMSVFRIINRDRNVLRPSLHWIAEEYLIYSGIIDEGLPDDKKRTAMGLDHWDNYYHVEYYVDNEVRRIVPRPPGY